jgi:hypothetical protein
MALPTAQTATAAELGTAPALISANVEVHTGPVGSTLAIDWVVAEDLGSGRTALTVDLVSETSTEVITMTSQMSQQVSGTLVSQPLEEVGTVYAGRLKLEDDQGHSRTYYLDENGNPVRVEDMSGTYDEPLNWLILSDIWFSTSDTPPVQPSAPELLSVMAGPGPHEVAVACLDANGFGLPVVEYAITAEPEDGSEPVTYRYSSDRCANGLTGLTAGLRYTVSVTARTGAGISEPSETYSVVPFGDVPTTPTGLTATAGNGSALLSWAPSDGRGLLVECYEVEWRGGGPDSEVEGFCSEAQGAAAGATLSLAGLVNRAEYQYRVRALNDIGWSPWSAWSDSFLPWEQPAVPDPPVVVAERTDPREIAVSWIPGAAPPSDPALEFQVELTSASDERTAQSDGGPVTISGLTDDESYDVVVRARNGAGWSSYSQVVTVDPLASPEPPGQVLAATASGRVGKAGLAWEPPAIGGDEVVGYRVVVQQGRHPAAGPLGPGTIVDVVQPTAHVRDLYIESDYTFTIFAKDAQGRFGEGVRILLKGTRTTFDGPGAPLAADRRATVTGQVLRTSSGLPVTGRSVVVQRAPSPGQLYFDQTRVTAITDSRGYYSVTFRARPGYAYRVALIKQPGLAGSATWPLSVSQP